MIIVKAGEPSWWLPIYLLPPRISCRTAITRYKLILCCLKRLNIISVHSMHPTAWRLVVRRVTEECWSDDSQANEAIAALRFDWSICSTTTNITNHIHNMIMSCNLTNHTIKNHSLQPNQSMLCQSFYEQLCTSNTQNSTLVKKPVINVASIDTRQWTSCIRVSHWIHAMSLPVQGRPCLMMEPYRRLFKSLYSLRLVILRLPRWHGWE